MSFLKKIKSPKDLKNLSLKDLRTLNNELRNYTINTVSKTGGHL